MKKILTMAITLGLVSPNALAQVTFPAQPAAGAEASGAPAISDGASGAPQDASSGGSNVMTTEAGADLPPPPSPIARLKPVTHEDVTYLCGGVGEEESSYMKQEAKDYDLMLTFATRKGAYLADVDVDITDAKGNTVLQMACDSPILLVDLPQGGTYRVKAETAGYALNQTVRVAGAKRQAPKVASTVLSWPQAVAEAGGAGVTATGSSGGEESKSRSGPR
jgi:hypothetical protein